jgi:hypothetical protein
MRPLRLATALCAVAYVYALSLSQRTYRSCTSANECHRGDECRFAYERGSSRPIGAGICYSTELLPVAADSVSLLEVAASAQASPTAGAETAWDTTIRGRGHLPDKDAPRLASLTVAGDSGVVTSLSLKADVGHSATLRLGSDASAFSLGASADGDFLILQNDEKLFGADGDGNVFSAAKALEVRSLPRNTHTYTHIHTHICHHADNTRVLPKNQRMSRLAGVAGCLPAPAAAAAPGFGLRCPRFPVPLHLLHRSQFVRPG